MVNPHIILVGGGGHCRSCIDVIEASGAYEIAGVVDRAELQEGVLGYRWLGKDTDLPALIAAHRHALVSIGQIGSAALRTRLFSELMSLGAAFPTIVSPNAAVSRHAEIGAGSIVMHGAIVNAGARIGRNVIINSRALVEHDAVIGDHSHISTAAVVNGGTSVGDGSFIGSGAVLMHGLSIGAGSVVGMGLSVRKSHPEGAKVLERD